MSGPSQSGPSEPEALRRLSVAQLADLARAVEQHGTELGMLLGALMGLVSRHGVEAARAESGEGGGGTAEELARLRQQLVEDHASMARFESPLLVLRQFHDRLRQRLEHLGEALGPGEAAAATPALVERAHSLFPLPEERAATAAFFGVDDVATDGPDTELF